MGRISAGEAIGAGFRLIGREPVAFLAWALAYLVVGMLPQLWAISAMLPLWSTMLAEAGLGAGPDMADMMRLQAHMMMVQPVSYLTSLVSQALLLGAVYRAVLFPDDRRFFYLRFGVRELWLGLLLLVMVVMMVIALFVAMIPFLIVVAIVAIAGEESLALVIPLLSLLLFGVFVWLALRFSLAPVMTFAERNFRFFESWTVTAGHAAGMFLVLVALAVIVLLAQGVLLAAGLVAAGATIGATAFGDAWLDNPAEALGRLGWGFWGVAAVVVSIVSAAIFVLFGGAWAEMYRQLRPDEPAAA